MKNHLILCLLCLLTFTGKSQTTYSKEVEDKIHEIEHNIILGTFRIEGMPNATIQERMAYHKVKGLSIAVIRNYKIEWAKGYGWADSAEQRPVTSETLFEPGSISKSLNALAVLKLVQDKKLELDKDINTYLTSWKFPYDSVSKNKKITLANILSHTAGLSVHGFPGYFKGDEFPTIPQILDGKKPANTASVRSIFEPGLQFKYSGGGTMISELIQMDITKLPYDEHIRKTVLEPIGMTNSFFTQPPPAGLEKRLATGYDSKGIALPKKYPVMIEQAAGGIWTTPTDLCKFIIEMQLSLIGKSNKVLDKAMTKKMMTPYIDKSAALGVFIQNVNGVKYFEHGAGNQGFSGDYYGSLEGGNGLAIVMNSENGGSLIQEVIVAIATAYQWKEFYANLKPVVKKTIALPDSVKKKYAGVYRQKTSVTVITLDNGSLVYDTDGNPWKMHFTSPTEFFNLESMSEKTFQINSKGEVSGFSKKLNRKDMGTSVKMEITSPTETMMENYTGTFSDDGQEFRILKKGQNLWKDPGYGTVFSKLNFISETEFFLSDDFGVVYQFVKDTKGNVEKLIMLDGDETITVKKIK